MHVKLHFNHPVQGEIDTFLVVEDMADLGRQLRLDPRIQLIVDDNVIYAALPDDALTDIGEVLVDSVESSLGE